MKNEQLKIDNCSLRLTKLKQVVELTLVKKCINTKFQSRFFGFQHCRMLFYVKNSLVSQKISKFAT